MNKRQLKPATQATMKAYPQFFYNDLTGTLDSMCLTFTPYWVSTSWRVGLNMRTIDITDKVIERMGTVWDGFIPSEPRPVGQVVKDMTSKRTAQRLLYPYLGLEDWIMYEMDAITPIEWVSNGRSFEDWWGEQFTAAALSYYETRQPHWPERLKQEDSIRWAAAQWDLSDLDVVDDWGYNGH